MKQIPLTKGKYALVDDEDYEYLMQWKWYCTSIGYAARGQHVAGKKKKWDTAAVYMHRVISNAPDGMVTDHIDRDKLNNQRSNLRICKQYENSRNSSKPKNNTSGYKGVWLHKKSGKWLAGFRLNRKGIHLGYFADKTDAARAYNEAVIKYFGEFAQLNEI